MKYLLIISLQILALVGISGAQGYWEQIGEFPGVTYDIDFVDYQKGWLTHTTSVGMVYYSENGG